MIVFRENISKNVCVCVFCEFSCTERTGSIVRNRDQKDWRLGQGPFILFRDEGMRSNEQTLSLYFELDEQGKTDRNHRTMDSPKIN